MATQTGPALGLIDTGLTRVRELDGADLTVRDFSDGSDGGDGATAACPPALAEHGTFSASLLVAQRGLVRGLVPRARLCAATVCAADGSISDAAVAAALAWLITEGCAIIAIPLGSDRDAPEVAAAVASALARGARIFAAAGDTHPAPLAFPARAPGVIAVGALDESGQLLAECNRLPRLDARAPGLARGLVSEGCAEVRRGSSIACVLAAGSAAQPL